MVNMIGSFVLVFFSVLLGVAGELLLKTGMNKVGELKLGGVEAALHTAWRVATIPEIIVGFACYGIAAVLWLVVLSRLDLSYAYPLLALMYVLVPLSAKFFLHEEIPAGRWVGIMIILVGIVVVARYTHPEP
jgi:drug/metabolite transporter (DMT)-like permease